MPITDHEILNKIEFREMHGTEYPCLFDLLVSGVPRTVIYNVDEVGFDEWGGATRQPVFIPIDYEGSRVLVPRNRSNSRASMVRCASAGGHALKSVMVIPCKATEIELYECGFTSDAVSLVWQESGLCTARHFEE
jgi:hypothetical protein